MRRLERLHAITDHLRARSPRTVSAKALADRFGVSSRTIERDLRSLQDSGVPIYGVEGRSGGYAILPDYSLPPLNLTALEATACLAALNLLEDSPLEPAARSALAKLRVAMPAPMAAAQPVLSMAMSGRVPTAVWIDAVASRTLVRLRYDADPCDRLVEPYTTLHAAGSWYLIGWCRSRRAVRGFRTDRVRNLTATSEGFLPIHAAAVGADLERWSPRPIT